ncbi:MAG: hypothetical protein IJ595_02135, partial [Oscillospiraceae bacterium]|nr:hypothetical protein [Oscillospiraceae bacterium]
SVKPNANYKNLDVYAVWPDTNAEPIKYTGNDVQKIKYKAGGSTVELYATLLTDSKNYSTTTKSYTGSVSFLATGTKNSGTMSVGAIAFTKAAAGTEAVQLGSLISVDTSNTLTINANMVSDLQLYDEDAKLSLIGTVPSTYIAADTYNLWIGDTPKPLTVKIIADDTVGHAILTFSAVNENGTTMNGITFCDKDGRAKTSLELNASSTNPWQDTIYVKGGTSAVKGAIKVVAHGYTSTTGTAGAVGQDYTETSCEVEVVSNPISNVTTGNNITASPEVVATGGTTQLTWKLKAAKAPVKHDGDDEYVRVTFSDPKTTDNKLNFTEIEKYKAEDIYDADAGCFVISTNVTVLTGASSEQIKASAQMFIGDPGVTVEPAGTAIKYGYAVEGQTGQKISASATLKFTDLTVAGDGDLYMGGFAEGTDAPKTRTITATLTSTDAMTSTTKVSFEWKKEGSSNTSAITVHDGTGVSKSGNVYTVDVTPNALDGKTATANLTYDAATPGTGYFEVTGFTNGNSAAGTIKRVTERKKIHDYLDGVKIDNIKVKGEAETEGTEKVFTAGDVITAKATVTPGHTTIATAGEAYRYARVQWKWVGTGEVVPAEEYSVIDMMESYNVVQEFSVRGTGTGVLHATVLAYTSKDFDGTNPVSKTAVEADSTDTITIKDNVLNSIKVEKVETADLITGNEEAYTLKTTLVAGSGKENISKIALTLSAKREEGDGEISLKKSKTANDSYGVDSNINYEISGSDLTSFLGTTGGVKNTFFKVQGGGWTGTIQVVATAYNAAGRMMGKEAVSVPLSLKVKQERKIVISKENDKNTAE